MEISKKKPVRRPKQWNLAKNRWASYGVPLVDPFPIEKLQKFERIWISAQKQKEHRNENFWKNTISVAETMEFGEKR